MTEGVEFDGMRYGGRASVLAGVRRVEAAALVGLSILLLAADGVGGVLFAVPLVASAVLLLPRQRGAARSTREERRQELLNRLSEEAMALRAAYVRAKGLPASPERSQALHQAHREIIIWIESSKARLKPYAEFRGIFEAHGGQRTLVAELDGRIARLAEVRRLGSMSRRLGLPI